MTSGAPIARGSEVSRVCAPEYTGRCRADEQSGIAQETPASVILMNHARRLGAHR